ncbi:hypothetical protein SFC65_24225 [Priestia filamentosa]|uniref:hypothetical protein n=1 Tax=Priestia filamentosa TaxID=1402861 RepID=UPI0039821519
MNRKRIILIFIVILIISLILSFNYISAYSEKLTKTTDLSNEAIGEIKLHENIEALHFKERYSEVLDKDDNALYDYYHWKGGLETASINEGKAKGIILRLVIEGKDDSPFNNSLQTYRGIKLGTKKSKIISEYGENYYKSSEQGANIIGYVDHENNITLEFWCDSNNRVFEIRLDDIKI